MSQLSTDFAEREEFWEDVNEVIVKLEGQPVHQDLVRKIVLIRDQENVIALRDASNSFNECLEACHERKLIPRNTLENLTDLFEDAMAIELGVFELTEMYNPDEDVVH